MRMSKPNIILMIIIVPIAALLGSSIGSSFPLFGLVALVGCIGFVAWVLLGNKQGKAVDGARLADARSIIVPAGKARIYVVRKGFVGGMQGLNVAIDGRFDGQIRSNFFMLADVEPGEHSVSARMAKQSEAARADHKVTLAAGGFVVINIGLEMGMVRMTPYFTDITDPAEARTMLAGAKMVDWLSPG